MKRLLVLLAAWLAASTCQAEVDRAALIGLGASVMKIEVLRGQGGFSIGSGVVVAEEKVVTNCHVTRDAVRVNVMRGGARWLASAQLRDVAHDLCLLEVPGLKATVISFGQATRLKPGLAVMALGYSGGGELQHSDGDVVALHRYDGSDVIQSSNWFNSGASGGGLFDADLRLVGILTFRLRGGEAHYFAAPAEWVRSLLAVTDRARFLEVTPDISRELSYWQLAPESQPKFLKAALLERTDRWPELESLAADWVRADSSDPEPWYLMGVALARMNRLPEAQRALECSLTLEPALQAAWARLGPVVGQQGQVERAHEIEAHLKRADASVHPAARVGAGAVVPCSLEQPAPKTP
ncbi:MAG: serine protease [Caldimonas sp.]